MDGIQWNDQYDDPEAKIILISNDNVGFRISAWTFKKKSGFIRGLLDVPSHRSLDSAPIYLDYPSTTVLSFVQQLHDQNLHHTDLTMSLTPDICNQLFELSDRFDAPQVNQIVSQAICMRLKIPPAIEATIPAIPTINVWEVFRLGALRDEFEIARAAIAAMDDAGLTEEILFANDARSFASFEDLPMRYVYPLLTLRYKMVKREMSVRGMKRPRVEAVWVRRDSKAIPAIYELS